LRDRELVERDLRLVGRALDHRRQRPGLERSRQGVGELQRAAHEWQKVREVFARLAGGVAHLRQELLDRRIPARDAECRRLVHGQRAQTVRLRRREQGDHASVGMPYEMVAGLQQLGDRLRLRLKVGSVDRGVRRIARPIRNHQRVAVGQRPERIPRRAPVADASMHEDDPWPAADRLDVEVGHERKITREQSRP
jgi:hypothetical protein